MSTSYTLSESARTRPNLMTRIEKIRYAELSSYNIEPPRVYKKSPILLRSRKHEEFSKNCFVEVINSPSESPEKPRRPAGEKRAKKYSIINVDPNITTCIEHSDLYLHEDVTLIKPGDKFDTYENFRRYIDRNAERWHYYYSCADSHTRPDKEHYIYRCVYGKPKNDYQPRGLRRRESVKRNCPCKVVLKRLSYNATVLTVIFVCNHHNHELSHEAFSKLQHGRRLPAKVKEEIMDLLYLDAEPGIIADYARSLTGLCLKTAYFRHVARTMKKNNMQRHYSPEKLSILHEKIADIRRRFERPRFARNSANNGIQRQRSQSDTDSAEIESQENESADTRDDGLSKRSSEMVEHQHTNKKSRLETCLQKLSHDEETLQSVKRLQSSVQCETVTHPWIEESIRSVPNGSATIDQGSIMLQNEYQDVNEANVVEDVHIDNVSQNEEIELTVVALQNDGDLPDSYVVENCTLESYEVNGEERTECEIIYDDDFTETIQQIDSDETVEEIPDDIESNQTENIQGETQVSSNNETAVNNDTTPSPDYDYIHRYNIDQYMKQPWFPKYIEKVAEDTNISIINILTDIYLGKTMFRMIETKKMEAKTIRISYFNENVPTFDLTDTTDCEYKADATKYCKKFMTLKKKLSDSSRHVRALNETLTILTKENNKLRSRNAYLENIQNESQINATEPSQPDEENEVETLRETKETLLSEISEAQNQIAHLEEIKKNLKTDICKFVSKKVLLKQVSGASSTERLNEVKMTLANAINKSKGSITTSIEYVDEEYIDISNEDEEG